MAAVDILQAIILGAIQGLTEWLPISSSGHLALVQLAMGLKVPVFYDAVLHLGTLTGVFAIYRKDIANVVKSIFGQNRAEAKEGAHRPQGGRMLWFIVLGTIPTATIGLAFSSFFEYSFYDPLSIGVGFIVTGVFVLITLFLKAGSKKLDAADAVLIGVGQGLSIFSSISRSGATVAAGMFRGVEREQLVRYSFLLSVPAILGAAAVDMISADEQERAELYSIGIESYIVGAAISAAVGYASIRVLIRLVIRGKFYLFAFYCFAIGIATFLLL
ncbi:putative undecaprenyl-diphosphatase [Candidatus Nitrososphaera gargensis Ga9.2]|uniref:Undecaprenyl-diphosphatase n=1 Tax=Nitrososphaera gargensis (strain Ga9.2) TaxID=1237085 RepID=K0IK28_NITGG|nr:undecaprenyl-diphosphate phosphatase [Candidatus Nitrososphaera gargensis]AFU60485.1 putative undecaprenyl-diphosphatase [Candidatus Nitrososphaera gargensis Ga9.2]